MLKKPWIVFNVKCLFHRTIEDMFQKIQTKVVSGDVDAQLNCLGFGKCIYIVCIT